jgi:hypothetical protein
MAAQEYLDLYDRHADEDQGHDDMLKLLNVEIRHKLKSIRDKAVQKSKVRLQVFAATSNRSVKT